MSLSGRLKLGLGANTRMNQLAEQLHLKDELANHEWESTYLSRFLRVTCNFLAFFNGIDLFENKLKPAQDDRSDSKTGCRGTKLAKSLWPLIVKYLYVHCSIRLVVNCALQYVYDYHLIELERLRNHAAHYNAAPAAATGNATIIASTEMEMEMESKYRGMVAELEQRISVERSRIKLLGSPYMNVAYLLECGYIYLIWCPFAAFAQPWIHRRFIGPFNWSLMRALTDRRRELRSCNRMIAEELDRFISSSRNFVRACIAEPRPPNQNLLSLQIKLANTNLKQTPRLLADHAFTIGTLEQLALDGHLRPLNRSVEWARRISWLTLVLQTACAVGCTHVVYFLTFYVTSHKEWLGNIPLELDFMDIVMRVEILILCSICLIGVLTQVTNGVTIIDQIYYLVKLNARIKTCTRMSVSLINTIEGHHHQSAVAKGTSSCRSFRPSNKTQLELIEANRDALSGKILEALLHYKILVRQVKTMKRDASMLIFITLQIVLLAPILTFAHAPLFRSSMIMVMIVGSGFLMLGLYCCLMPACYMSSRGAEIYRTMSNLLAAQDDLIQICRDTISPQNLFDSHLVWALRRELSAPSQMIDHFTFNVLGIPFTYRNLLKTQFWAGLLCLFALAICNASSSSSSQAGKTFTNTFLIL